jgi:hypothetical protein
MISENVSLVLHPPNSPELNLAMQIWYGLCKNSFANLVFDSFDVATSHAEFGLAEMATSK